MIKVLVTGANGQLGKSLTSIVDQFPEISLHLTDVAELDICNEQIVTNFFEKNHFDYCINCAAYTAVDKAEEEKEKADLINHKAVQFLTEAAARQQCKFIQISTDFVFDGKGHLPYSEQDSCTPLSVYGRTKRDGEQVALNNNGIVIRTSWLYSSFGGNFVSTMMRLGSERDELSVIFDQVGTPTYALDLAKFLMTLCKENNKALKGMYHFSNEGVASWYDFAAAVFEYAALDCTLKPIRTEAYPTPAERPKYSVLDKTKVKTEFSYIIPYWRTSLKECITLIKRQL